MGRRPNKASASRLPVRMHPNKRHRHFRTLSNKQDTHTHTHRRNDHTWTRYARAPAEGREVGGDGCSRACVVGRKSKTCNVSVSRRVFGCTHTHTHTHTREYMHEDGALAPTSAFLHLKRLAAQPLPSLPFDLLPTPSGKDNSKPLPSFPHPPQNPTPNPTNPM